MKLCGGAVAVSDASTESVVGAPTRRASRVDLPRKRERCTEQARQSKTKQQRRAWTHALSATAVSSLSRVYRGGGLGWGCFGITGVSVQIPDRRLAQAGVDLVQRGRARTQRLLVKLVERRIHRAEMGVQIFRLRIDVEQAGDDLALGGVPLQEAHRRDPIMRVIIRIDLAQRQS